MLYIISGFLFGFSIPYMARRFSKFMPATMAYALYRLVWPVKRVSKQKRKQNGNYQNLMHKYLMRSLGWGVVCAALTHLSYLCLPSLYFVPLIWILLLLYEIDERMFLLPDLLTVPLLILGFIHAASLPLYPQVSPFSPAMVSALGAAAGYILPVVATLFMVKKHPDAFGGGDVKLLAAIGAWLGFDNIPLVILFSCIIFGAFCLIKRERAGAFGPALVISTLALVFFLS